jgi:HK97 family phage portal protein
MNIFQRTSRALGKFFLGNSQPVSGFWSWSIPGGKWNKRKLMAQYDRYVYAIVSAIAEESAKINFEVYNKADKIVQSHPFLSLIKKPNPDQSQFQFLELHFTYMKLTGESYWYLVSGERSKKPKELYLLRPDLMEVVIDEDDPAGNVKGYEYSKPDGKKEKFDKSEILHFKTPNPVDPKYGMGTVQASRVYIQTEDFSSNWTKNSIYNSGRPSGILNVKGVITPDEFKQIKRQFKDTYSGVDNAGKTMLLKGADGIDYQKLGMELGEVAMKELKDMTRDDIMVMFRVSKTVLGVTDDVNRASAMEARAVFTRNVIMPEVDRFIDHINAFLMPTWTKDTTLKYEDPTLQTDQDRLEEWVKGHNKWLTTNDIRAERELDPIKGGDVIREPINMVPTMGDFKPVVAESKKKRKGVNREEVFDQEIFKIQDIYAKEYQEFITQEFEIQEKEILKGKKANFVEWLFDKEAADARLITVLNPLGIQLVSEVAKIALGMAGDDDTEFLIDEHVTNYVYERVGRIVPEMNTQTINSIEASIAEGIAQGESVAQLKKRIKEIYIDATDVRAERIARTESLAASNQGAMEAYRQSPLVIGKEWRTTIDPCEFCAALDGKIVELNESYADLGGTFTGQDGGLLKIGYETIEHPPLHPNCRCTLLPVVLDR